MSRRLALAVGYTQKGAEPVVLYCGPSYGAAKDARENPDPALGIKFAAAVRISGARLYPVAVGEPTTPVVAEDPTPAPAAPAPAEVEPDPEPAEEPQGLAKIARKK